MQGDSIHTFENGGTEKGFFCMNLVKLLLEEREAGQMGQEQFQALWKKRFDEAKAGSCHYRNHCYIYLRGLKQGVQLSLF